MTFFVNQVILFLVVFGFAGLVINLHYQLNAVALRQQMRTKGLWMSHFVLAAVLAALTLCDIYKNQYYAGSICFAGSALNILFGIIHFYKWKSSIIKPTKDLNGN